MKVILSTRNPSKAKGIIAVFKGVPIQVLTLDQAGIAGEVIEDGATLEENAEKKARFAWEHSKQWSIADDTGLFIDVLEGRPGIHAARWTGEESSTEDIMHFTLEKLAGVPPEKRTATFKTVAAVIEPDGTTYFFTGEVQGTLLEAPRTPCPPKMPYSALFVPDGYQKTWSEMTTDEANAISHRGIAFRKVRTFLQSQLQE